MADIAALLAQDIAAPGDVAAALGITVGSLAQMRHRKLGPPYTRVGATIRYRWSDIQKYLAAQTIEHSA